MNRLRKETRWWILLFAPLLFCAFSLRDLNLPTQVPTTSSYSSVDPIVEKAEEPGFVKFKITASHARYETEGILPLVKLLHEIEIIERVERDEAGSGFMDGAVDSVMATGNGFKKLVTHPVDSIVGLGEATGKLGRSVGGIFRQKSEAEKTSLDEKIFGSSKREIAKKFGVDVCSTNPNLQQLLDNMARARMGGKGATVIAKFLIPVAGLVSVTMTASGVNGAADQWVNDKNRGEIYRLNREALSVYFSSQEVEDFLNSPYYSPRESSYLRFYLEKLKDLEGFRQILKQANEAKNLWEARKILYEAQIAAQAVPANPDFKKITCTAEGLALEDPKKIVLIAPFDYLDSSGGGDLLLKKALELRNQSGKAIEIWNGGKISLSFSAQLQIQGMKTKDWLLLEDTTASNP